MADTTVPIVVCNTSPTFLAVISGFNGSDPCSETKNKLFSNSKFYIVKYLHSIDHKHERVDHPILVLELVSLYLSSPRKILRHKLYNDACDQMN